MGSRIHAAALGVVVAQGVEAALGQELVFNGGFETGNFLGWNVPPNIPMQSQFTVNSDSPHSGLRYAQLSSSTLQYVSQTLPTTAGQDYELSFWLRWTAPMLAEQVTVRWEGQLASIVPGTLQTIPWTQYTIPLHSNISGSFLEFGQTAFPGEFHIDDISVAPVPGPSAAPLLVMGGVVAAMRRRRRGGDADRLSFSKQTSIPRLGRERLGLAGVVR